MSEIENEWGYWRLDDDGPQWQTPWTGASRAQAECLRRDYGNDPKRGPVQRRSDPNPFEAKTAETYVQNWNGPPMTDPVTALEQMVRRIETFTVRVPHETLSPGDPRAVAERAAHPMHYLWTSETALIESIAQALHATDPRVLAFLESRRGPAEHPERGVTVERVWACNEGGWRKEAEERAKVMMEIMGKAGRP